MKAIPYSVSLLENVLVGDPAAEDPNTTGGLNYIPGSVMRGVIVELLMGSGKYILNEEIRQLWLDGDVKYLNAYLSIRESEGGEKRTRPTPFSLQKMKDEEEKVLNVAVQSADELEAQLEKLRVPFIWNDPREGAGGDCYGYKPMLAIRLHNKRAEGDAPNAQDSQLFTYSSLSAGQVLRGWMISENDKALQKLKDLLPAGTIEVDIGKSRHAEYGRVRIEFEEILTDWRELVGNPSEQTGEGLVVTLLSDVILRDPTDGSFASDLNSILGAEFEKAFTKSKVIGGFNRKWGFPLPQCRAISAGSVFIYPNTPEILENLRRLVENGVGERTIDGYGRIALEPMREVEYDFLLGRLEKAELRSTIEMDGESAGLLKDIAERIFLKRVRAEIPGLVQKTRVVYAPSNTQLSRLNRVLRLERSSLQADPNRDFVHIEMYIESLTKNTRSEINNCYIDKQPLVKWLEDWMGNPLKIWQKLININEKVPNIPDANLDKDTYVKLILVEYIRQVIKRELNIDKKTRVREER